MAHQNGLLGALATAGASRSAILQSARCKWSADHRLLHDRSRSPGRGQGPRYGCGLIGDLSGSRRPPRQRWPRAMVAATSPYPASKSALTGRSVAATIRAIMSSTNARGMCYPSGQPTEAAIAALAVARAWQPGWAATRAEATSQTLASTK